MLLYKIGENPLTLYLCKYSFYSDNENVFPLCLWHNFPVFLYRNIHELSTNSCFFSILLASLGYKRQIYDDKNPTLSLFYSTMYSQIHPLNLKYSIHLYACKLPLKKDIWKQPNHSVCLLEFSRDKNAAMFIFPYSSSLCIGIVRNSSTEKQHGERSSENETMTIYPDSLEQRWPLGMIWLSLSMHCQRDEEGDRKTRRIKTGCW